MIDSTALVKQGTHSAGVARQYRSQLGMRATCQSLITLTLARGQVPVPIWMKLFVPASWAEDAQRCQKALVPESERRHRPEWEMPSRRWIRRALPECGSAWWARMRSRARHRSFAEPW